MLILKKRVSKYFGGSRLTRAALASIHSFSRGVLPPLIASHRPWLCVLYARVSFVSVQCQTKSYNSYNSSADLSSSLSASCSQHHLLAGPEKRETRCNDEDYALPLPVHHVFLLRVTQKSLSVIALLTGKALLCLRGAVLTDVVPKILGFCIKRPVTNSCKQ